MYLASVQAFNRRDRDAFLALVDHEVEIESRLVAVEGGYHGHEGLRRWWDNFLGTFPDYTLDIEELRDLGDVTLGDIRGWGHGADSATPLVDPSWHPVKWRNGKVVWWRNCATEAEALEAVGLSQRAMSQENLQRVREQYAPLQRGRAGSRPLVLARGCRVPTPPERIRTTPRIGGSMRSASCSPAGLRPYPDLRLEIQQARSTGRQGPSSGFSFTGHGAASGIPLEMELAHVCTLRDGKAGQRGRVHGPQTKPSRPWGCRSRRRRRRTWRVHAGALRPSLEEGQKRWSTSGTPKSSFLGCAFPGSEDPAVAGLS